MKRIFALILALMSVLTLCACGESSNDDIKNPSSISSDTTAPEQELEATITEAVIFEENGITVTAKGLDASALFGPELKLLIENESGKNLTFQATNASINGYMIETMMSVDVVSGKKANDALTFLSSDLEYAGITTIADMEFCLHIFETDTWETYQDSDPIKLQTSAAEGFSYTFDDSGELAHEGNGVKIVVKGLSEDASFMGPSVIVYIENNTDELLTFQSRDVSINGFMVESYFSCDVAPGKHAIDSITFLSSELEENDITSIEDIDLSFTVFNFDTWETVVDTNIISIHF